MSKSRPESPGAGTGPQGVTGAPDGRPKWALTTSTAAGYRTSLSRSRAMITRWISLVPS